MQWSAPQQRKASTGKTLTERKNYHIEVSSTENVTATLLPSWRKKRRCARRRLGGRSPPNPPHYTGNASIQTQAKKKTVVLNLFPGSFLTYGQGPARKRVTQMQRTRTKKRSQEKGYREEPAKRIQNQMLRTSAQNEPKRNRRQTSARRVAKRAMKNRGSSASLRLAFLSCQVLSVLVVPFALACCISLLRSFAAGSSLYLFRGSILLSFAVFGLAFVSRRFLCLSRGSILRLIRCICVSRSFCIGCLSRGSVLRSSAAFTSCARFAPVLPLPSRGSYWRSFAAFASCASLSPVPVCSLVARFCGSSLLLALVWRRCLFIAVFLY